MVATGFEFGDVDVASTFRQPGHQVVAGRQTGIREDSRYDLASGIATATHSATIQPFLRAQDPIAPDSLCWKKEREKMLENKGINDATNSQKT